MSAHIVLLCEDADTDRFVRRFLSHRNFKARDIHTVELPLGKQSGEQWVRTRYPAELKAIRLRQNAFLLAIIDADNRTTEARRTQLDQECDEQEVPGRTSGEPVIVMVPRRNIETWFAYLDGQTVDETTTYPRRTPADQRSFADRLYRMCHERQHLVEPVPSSLTEACLEYRKLQKR